MKRILIIEDDAAFRDAVVRLLSDRYEALTADSGMDGIRVALEQKPDLILVDVALPGLDGFEVCRRIREKHVTRDIPLIMLTGAAEMESKVKGLELGADDYVVKPFESRELLARIKARLRRHDVERKVSERIVVANLVVEPRASSVTVDGRPVSLTQAEFRMLQYFLERPETLISREKLLGDLWPDAIVSSRTVDTHIAHIRRKLKGAQVEIKTVFRAGYMMKRA